MAYADETHTGRKLGTGAAVLLIEGGLAFALVIGLAATGSVDKVPNIQTWDFKDPPKNPPPPPPPVDKQAKDSPSVVDRPKTEVELPPNAGASFATEPMADAGTPAGDSIGEVTFPRPPEPVPSPEPLFKPKGASPKGAWKQWVTTNDYPAQALRMEQEGTTRYRLEVTADGKVGDCTITATSGFPALDKAACDTLRRRAKFEAATDQTGARVAGFFTGSVAWQIPKE